MNVMGEQPLVLDFDGSAGVPPGATVVPLAGWQQRIRFGCTLRSMAALRHALAAGLPFDPGTVFTGSGDFHHVSLLLIERLARHGPLDVIVLDNHPDNMRYPWGIHCGSWVSHVTALPFVRHVQVMGIGSPDVRLRHALENRLLPLFRGRLSYWCIGNDIGWARHVGLGTAIRNFDSARAMLNAFAEQQAGVRHPVYLSLDKDVLSTRVARTNWDQGVLLESDVVEVVLQLARRLAGCDITGDVSAAHYTARWKRWLSAVDAQLAVGGAELLRWQAEQQALNARLLQALAASRAAAAGLAGTNN
ncbi:MAG: hypothetical protein ABI343_04210 [Burkholderiaceae bacterium]